MADRPLSPLNDFDRTVLIEEVNSSGVVVPVTSIAGGAIVGFLAAGKEPSAIAADASWNVNGVYIGGANGFDAGVWLFQIDASALTAALLDSEFATAVPYFIVQRTNGKRRYEKLKYTPSWAADLA